MNTYAVVMAGGFGIRLWPISTRNRPKQFMKTPGGKPMIAAAIEHMNGIVPFNNCYIVTNASHKELVNQAVAGMVPENNILCEPARKNTCACITYASLSLKKLYGEGIICFIPSDSFIKDESAYRMAILEALKVAEESCGMVIVGITPSYPSTAYGYIKTGPYSQGINCNPIKVVEFLEKPCIEKAVKYVASGEYLWNSGILVGNVDEILKNVEKYKPDIYYALSEAVDGVDREDAASLLQAAYNRIENISFDFGVLEKCSGLLAVKGDFEWCDIGSLDGLDKIYQADAAGNSITGNHVGINTSNSVIYSENGLIATIGLDNIVIVHTGDAILVCPREKTQEIRYITYLLLDKGYERFL